MQQNAVVTACWAVLERQSGLLTSRMEEMQACNIFIYRDIKVYPSDAQRNLKTSPSIDILGSLET